MIGYWRDYLGADYRFCFTDETTLKTMIRSNPGLMLIKGGTIYAKWHHKQLPTEYDLTSPDLSSLPAGQMQGRAAGMVVVYVLLLYLLPLALIIGIETIWLKANDIKHPGKE